MEKNINQKKRVAHLKSGFDDDIEDGCRDYVSSIIKDMDSNLKTVQPNKLFLSKNKTTSLTGHKSNDRDTSPSTSKPCTQVINNILKSKKFGLSRKFPLMEKSQKILKHIKHNQRIPKQRAHLASYAESLSERNITCNNSEICIQKNLKQDTTKIKKRGNVPSDKKHDSTNNFYIFNKDSRHSKSKASKVCKKINKCTVDEAPSFKNSVHNEDNVVNDNKNDTTDSEYEKFLKNNKTNLKKKLKHKSVKKTKAKRRSSKKIQHDKISKLTDYHSSDDTSSSTNEYRKRKKIKFSTTDRKKKRQNKLLSDSESDIVNNDIFTRDISSDSDTAGNETTTKNPIDFEFVEQRESGHGLVPERHSLNLENNVTSVCPEYLSCNHLSSANNTAKENSSPMSTDCLEQSNFSSDGSLVTSKVSFHNLCKNAVTHDFPIESLPEKEDNYVITNTNQSVTVSNNEESDIEIIEIIVPKSKNMTIKSGKENKKEDFSGNFIAGDSKNKNLKEIKIDEVISLQQQEQVKTKEQLQVEDKMQKYKNDSDKERKSEAVFITDICKEFNQEIDSKVNILEQSNSNLMLNNTFNVSKNLSSHNVVKKEDSEDDILVVDCILKKNLPCGSCVSFKNKKTKVVKTETLDSTKNIKTENCFMDLTSMNEKDLCSHEILNDNEKDTLKDLKLYEVACSNLPLAKNLSSETFSEQSQEKTFNVKDLLELFKKEFQIYQGIIQTEANVEKSLKALESYQAEKLKNIRSLIQKFVVDKQCLGEGNNSKVNEHLHLLCKSQEISKLEESENKIFPECSPTGIMEDLKNSYLQKMPNMSDMTDKFLSKFSTSNVPSQSILLPEDRDVKLDLSVLHNIPDSVLANHSTVKLKVEPASVQDMPNASTLKLLGEKCNACGKDAVAACQRCAKVFFCSNECGMKYWIDVHENECGK